MRRISEIVHKDLKQVTAYVKILPQQTHLFPTNCTIGFKAATHFLCKQQPLHKYTILLKSN